MENMTNDLKKSLIKRSYAIVEEISASNPEYKQLSKESMRLEEELNKQLSHEWWKVFDDNYQDTKV